MVARSKEDADEMRRQRAAGVPIRTVIGQAIGAGNGKPPNNIPTSIVQLRTASGAVVRESAVPTPDAPGVALAWGPRAVILSVQETLSRRQMLHDHFTLQ